MNHSPLLTQYTIQNEDNNKTRTRQDKTTKPFAPYIPHLYLSPHIQNTKFNPIQFLQYILYIHIIKMIYQQTMLSSTVEPASSHRSSLSSSVIKRRKIPLSSLSSKEQEQQRSVNFSSCTKKQEALENSKQAGVKRLNSSSSVPIPECMLFRTPSELQLTVDEEVADQRDFAFFARLVSGISERRGSSTSTTETDRCLTHIIQTRHHHHLPHDDQEEAEAEGAHCNGIFIEDDDYQVGTGGGEGEGVYYYLSKDNDCFTTISSSSSSSSSSSNSSILYQHEFVEYDDHKATHRNSNSNNDDDLYNDEGGDCECMFDLEL